MDVNIFGVFDATEAFNLSVHWRFLIFDATDG